jgi:hypothetical protein
MRALHTFLHDVKLRLGLLVQQQWNHDKVEASAYMIEWNA